MEMILYTIQPGDTLTSIANAYGTTVPVLARLNGLIDPDRIYAGQRIRIPVQMEPVMPMVYVVQPGDTLCSIADQFHTTVGRLMRLNGITDPDMIYAGQSIRTQ